MSTISVIVPTFNEEANIAILVARIASALADRDAEVIFVDDSIDGTPETIRRIAGDGLIPVTLIHRDRPAGGLAGAVIAGLRASSASLCVVMDGDLQHPPEMIPVLLAALEESRADLAVASRYRLGGSSAGLSGGIRHTVSRLSTIFTRAMFPFELRDCSDPMTGFFAVLRTSVDVDRLRPRGFKILLEILGRHELSVVEEPLVFGEREAGESKASMRQGLLFLTQLAALKFGRLSGFAAVGALGAIANLLIMWGLQSLGLWYVAAAIISGAITILGNFLLQERFVFHDLRDGERGLGRRLWQSVAFNGSETAVRTALLWVIVESTPVPSILALAVLLCVGFLARFVFHSRIVYAPKGRTRDRWSTAPREAETPVDRLGG